MSIFDSSQPANQWVGLPSFIIFVEADKQLADLGIG